MHWQWEEKTCYLCGTVFKTRNMRRTACGHCQSEIGLCRCQLCGCVTSRLTCRDCSEKAQGIIHGGRQQKLVCFEKRFYLPRETQGLIWCQNGTQSLLRAVCDNIPRFIAVPCDWSLNSKISKYVDGVCEKMLQNRPSYDDFHEMLRDVSISITTKIAADLVLQYVTQGYSLR